MVAQPPGHHGDDLVFSMLPGIDGDIGGGKCLPQPLMLLFEDIGRPGGRTPLAKRRQIKIERDHDVRLAVSPEIPDDAVLLGDDTRIIAPRAKVIHERRLPGTAGPDHHNPAPIH